MDLRKQQHHIHSGSGSGSDSGSYDEDLEKAIKMSLDVDVCEKKKRLMLEDKLFAEKLQQEMDDEDLARRLENAL